MYNSQMKKGITKVTVNLSYMTEFSKWTHSYQNAIYDGIEQKQKNARCQNSGNAHIHTTNPTYTPKKEKKRPNTRQKIYVTNAKYRSKKKLPHKHIKHLRNECQI